MSEECVFRCDFAKFRKTVIIEFRMTQLEQSMKYNQGLQWEVKDENGVAIPLESNRQIG